MEKVELGGELLGREGKMSEEPSEGTTRTGRDTFPESEAYRNVVSLFRCWTEATGHQTYQTHPNRGG